MICEVTGSWRGNGGWSGEGASEGRGELEQELGVEQEILAGSLEGKVFQQGLGGSQRIGLGKNCVW